MGFNEEVNKIKLQTEACPLNILVWGPGEDSARHFEKRQKFRREIGKRFRNAEVRFSEDLDVSETLPGFKQMSYREQESWHLAACDVCVVLDTSSGAGEEIAYFVRSLHAYKLLILTHEKHKTSTNFPADIRRYQNQMFYDDQQYDTCDLVEQVLTRIHTVALGKLVGMVV